MIGIVTDSTAQLTSEEIKCNGIKIVPLKARIQGKEYRDKIDITREKFSTILSHSNEFPTTSQPSVGEFLMTYNSLSADYDALVSIHLGSALSGTVQSAKIAAESAKIPVFVIDSGTTDRGLGFVVLRAAQLCNSSYDIKEIVTQLQEYTDQLSLFCFIDNIDYLVRGGRASKALGYISSLIKLKLELEMKAGKLIVAAKSRGEKGLASIVSQVVNSLIRNHNVTQVGLSYVDSHLITDQIERKILENRQDISITNQQTSPTIMTHVGSHGFAIMTNYPLDIH